MSGLPIPLSSQLLVAALLFSVSIVGLFWPVHTNVIIRCVMSAVTSVTEHKAHPCEHVPAPHSFEPGY